MMLLGGLNGERTDATLCKDCRQCIERCPQHISIPDKLKEVEKDLGGPKTEAMMNAMRARMAQSQQSR
jgi:predicted aldo/keto reductase-like oxidoreductase